jgi:hypothetical protein
VFRAGVSGFVKRVQTYMRYRFRKATLLPQIKYQAAL